MMLSRPHFSKAALHLQSPPESPAAPPVTPPDSPAAQLPNSPVVAASRPSLLLSDSAFSSTRRRFQPCRRTALVAVEQHQAQPGPALFSATPPTASAAPADDLLCHCSAPYVDADAIAAMPCSVPRCSTSTTGAYFWN
ncbi:hypothetical protein AAHA92_17972 [Salvia divinorum]|uniref:Uncharacterized protein n=1 Tax=Salvia divinorum TaxID=28513 RepID=A0ABD1H0L9_SALDI